jgi:DNA-binding NarL/FixJ family response regulator
MAELPLKALVVDDNPKWRDLVSEVLADAGCSVTALARPPASPNGYHLAVLDVALNPDAPDNRDGLALLEQMPAHTRVVVLSGLIDGDLAARVGHRSNVISLIPKDAFRREALIGLVRQIATSPAPVLQVLIVEDDERWRAVYEELLSDAGYAPHFTVSYAEARGWLQRADFALAIVDLHLASSTAPHDNRDGFWLLRAAQQRGLPTIVVSALGSPEDIDRAYEELGVFAFIEKEGFDRRAFKRIVAEALDVRRPGVEPPAAPGVPDDEQPDHALRELTDREREVLALLSRGYTNRQIGEALRITPNTVKKHVDHILQKLGVSNRAGAVAVALRINARG